MFDWITDELARQDRERQQAIRSYYGNAYTPPAKRFVPKDYRTGLPRLTPRRQSPVHTRFKTRWTPRSGKTSKRGNSGPSDIAMRR